MTAFSRTQSAVPRVAVVHHRESVRQTAAEWLAEAGYAVSPFSSTDDFYKTIDPNSLDCIVIGYFFPDSLGNTIHGWLKSADSVTSVVFLTVGVTVPIAVELVLEGAVNLLQMPVSRERVLEVVGRAVSMTHARRSARSLSARTSSRLDGLTKREHEVCRHLVVGSTSKEIARALHISRRTVEHHRASLMRKSGASSIAELVSMVAKDQINGIRESPPRLGE
jgi:FixJ family two-component response regulator